MKYQKEQLERIEEIIQVVLRAQLNYFFDRTMDDRKNIPLSRKLIETVTEYLQENGVSEEVTNNVRTRLIDHVRDIFLPQCEEVHENHEGEVDEAYREETIDYFDRIYDGEDT